MKKILFQQGDLIIYKAESIPVGAKKIELTNKFTLLKGEGANTHDLVDAVGKVTAYEKDGVLHLNVEKQSSIVHQEHGVQEIEPGIGYRDVEQTFDYEQMESRNTQD